MRAALVFSALAVPLLLVGLGGWFALAPSSQTVSEVEARALAPLPAFSVAELRAGRYTRDLELYVADHFPLRDRFVAFTFGLRARFGVRRASTVYASKGGALGGFEQPQDWRPVLAPLPDAAVVEDPFLDEPAGGVLPGEDGGADDASATTGDGGGSGMDGDGGAAEPGELVAALDDAKAGGDGGSFDEGGGPKGVDAGELEASDVVVAAIDDDDDAGVPDGPATERGGVLIQNGRGMMLLSATDATARAFAKVLASYGAAFPKARVYAVMVPGAGAFYLPPSHRDRSADERHNLEVIRAALPLSVRWVDVVGALAAHADEPIYYRTDHHWTALGAYYGYRAMVEAAGLTPLAHDDFEWRRADKPTLGSLFRMTQDPVLRRTPDVTEYPLPPVEYQSVSYVGARYDVPQRRRFIDESESGYLVFMGGDAALMAAKTKVKNGRRALLVKNSFGNPLGPMLLPHFEQVVVVDYRLYFDTVAALVKRFRITDVFVQNASLTANDPYHRGRLKLALSTTVTFTDGGVVFGRAR